MSDERRPQTDDLPARPAAADDATEEHPPASTQDAESTGDGYTTRRRLGLDNAARVVSEGSATTLFQPGVMVESILEREGEASASSTWVLSGPPSAPKLQPEMRPYFLVVGAPAGRERIPIVASQTVFGRDQGDVRLADSAVSGRHFQLDVVGNECFLRDLGSRNGTQLNGHPIRYAEVLPGDEVRAGETVLVFRLENDELSR